MDSNVFLYVTAGVVAVFIAIKLSKRKPVVSRRSTTTVPPPEPTLRVIMEWINARFRSSGTVVPVPDPAVETWYDKYWKEIKNRPATWSVLIVLIMMILGFMYFKSYSLLEGIAATGITIGIIVLAVAVLGPKETKNRDIVMGLGALVWIVFCLYLADGFQGSSGSSSTTVKVDYYTRNAPCSTGPIDGSSMTDVITFDSSLDIQFYEAPCIELVDVNGNPIPPGVDIYEVRFKNRCSTESGGVSYYFIPKTP